MSAFYSKSIHWMVCSLPFVPELPKVQRVYLIMFLVQRCLMVHSGLEVLAEEFRENPRFSQISGNGFSHVFGEKFFENKAIMRGH